MNDLTTPERLHTLRAELTTLRQRRLFEYELQRRHVPRHLDIAIADVEREINDLGVSA